MSEFTRYEPGALEVRVDHVVPIGLGVLEQRLRDNDAGVVDEDRQWPELGLGLGDSRDNTVGSGHV